MENTSHTFGKRALVKKAWARFKEEPGTIIIGFFIAQLIGNALGQIGQYIQPENVISAIISFVLVIAGAGLSIWMGLGMINFMLKGIRGEEFDIEDLFAIRSGKIIWPAIVASILMGLAIFFGFIALIIPGIILSIMFMFTIYIIIDKKGSIGAVEAMKESARLTKGYRWQLFLLGLLLGLVNLLGLLALIIGLLVSIPVTLITTAYAYEHLKKVNGGAQA